MVGTIGLFVGVDPFTQFDETASATPVLTDRGRALVCRGLGGASSVLLIADPQVNLETL